MTARYMTVRDDLLRKIEDGTYAVGELIPSEIELVEEYAVSRSTVRKALRMLEAEGRLDRRRRRGTVVKAVETQEEVAQAEGYTRGDPWSIEDNIATQLRLSTTVPIVAKRTHATAEIAENLDIEPGEEVYRLVRLRYLNGEPNLFVENYIPVAMYPNLLDGVDFSRVRLHDRLRELGRPVKEQRNRVNVCAADESMATLLDVPEGDPLLVFHSTSVDMGGTVVEYAISTYRSANTFEFTVVHSVVLSNEELLG